MFIYNRFNVIRWVLILILFLLYYFRCDFLINDVRRENIILVFFNLVVFKLVVLVFF